MTARPFLILTLRRTGGTALTGFLGRLSAFGTAEHEAFNRDRAWGEVTRAFLETADETALRAAVSERLAARPNLKHCVEVVPLAVTRALIDAAAGRGYVVFLLTRRDEAARQLSLGVARATGAWGPKGAAEIYPEIVAGRRQAMAVDLARAGKQVRADARALGGTLSLLRHRGVAYDWLLFEELYGDGAASRRRAARLAAAIGTEMSAGDPRLSPFARSGGQDTDRVLDHVPGARELHRMLTRLVVT